VGEAAGAINGLEHAVDRHGEVRVTVRPTGSSAATSAFDRSSVASTVARNNAGGVRVPTGPSTTARTSRIASLASRRFDVEKAIICSPLPFEAWERSQAQAASGRCG
jgi:hypothetical protein